MSGHRQLRRTLQPLLSQISSESCNFIRTYMPGPGVCIIIMNFKQWFSRITIVFAVGPKKYKFMLRNMIFVDGKLFLTENWRNIIFDEDLFLRTIIIGGKYLLRTIMFDGRYIFTARYGWRTIIFYGRLVLTGHISYGQLFLTES